MNILFLGNSMLGSIYRTYMQERSLFENLNCSFALDIGSWGPAFKVVNNKITPSDRSNKEKYPDKFYPENLLEISLSSFDAVVLVSLGSIGGGINERKTPVTFGQIYDYQPKKNDLTSRPISRDEFIDTLHGFLNVQGGIKLAKSLRTNNLRTIIVEMPYLSKKIIDSPEWCLNKIYHDPISAYKFFCAVRKMYLQKMCVEFNIDLIPALFDDIGFTPENFVRRNDFFHTNEDYAKLLLGKILNILKEPLQTSC
jgi:hypothetical protein